MSAEERAQDKGREQVRKEIRLRAAESAAKAGRVQNGWADGFPTERAAEARRRLAAYYSGEAAEWTRVLELVELADAGAEWTAVLGNTGPAPEPECPHEAWEAGWPAGRPVKCADCGHDFTDSESAARWTVPGPDCPGCEHDAATHHRVMGCARCSCEQPPGAGRDVNP